MQIHRREDVDPQEGIRRYGDVEFADPVNNKYPIDTPEHVRAAWAYIHVARNAMFYTPAELELIKKRIIAAAERFGIELSEEVIERDAKLFSAGSYPDRGIEVSEADLDRMAQDHKPVPIKVEHVDSPLELGLVTRIWRVGKDLFGRLAFTAPAWELIQASGARNLSAAVKRDKTGLVEVSLVRQPRIADAAVFRNDEYRMANDEWGMANAESGDAAGATQCSGRAPSRPSAPQAPDDAPVQFSFELNDGGEDMSGSTGAEFSRKIADLERQLKEREVDSHIERLVRGGKLAPAAEGLARALLSVGDSQVVTFADGTEKPVAQTFLAFLEASPKVIEFSELSQGAREPVETSEAEREFYAKLGISPEAVAKHRGR